jgi:Holliday junction resolvase
LLIELPTRQADPQLIKRCLDLPEQLGQVLRRRLVIAIDEFQELATLGQHRQGFDPFPVMRSHWQKHERVGYVISGSSRSMLTALVSSTASPFFQHFELMDLGPLPQEVAARLLVEEAPDPSAISAEFATRSVSLLDGHPFYVQLFGEALTRSAPPYDDVSLKATLQQLLFDRSGRLALYFEREYRRLVGRSTYLAAVLTALAEASRRPAELARAIGAGTADTTRYVERLGDAVVRDDEGQLSLQDATFGLWLRWRQPGGAVVPMRWLGDDAEREAAVHLARLGFDLVYASRHSRGAFDLLATRGGLALGVQVKRSAALPLRFKKSEWNRMDADARRLKWRWVVCHVSPEGEVRLLDPGLARHGAEIRLGKEAEIESVLRWLDDEPRTETSA